MDFYDFIKYLAEKYEDIDLDKDLIQKDIQTWFAKTILNLSPKSLEPLIEVMKSNTFLSSVSDDILNKVKVYKELKPSKIRVPKEVKDEKYRIIRHGYYTIEFLNDPEAGTYQILAIYNDHNEHFLNDIFHELGIDKHEILSSKVFVRILNCLTKEDDPLQKTLWVGDFNISYRPRDLTDGRVKIYSINSHQLMIKKIEDALCVNPDDLDRYEFGKVLAYLSMVSNKQD